MALKKVLKKVDDELNQKQPKTMDELLELVRKVEGMKNYGSHYSIIQFQGVTQGVRVYICGTKNSHQLPFDKTKCYAVVNDVEKFIKAGWTIEVVDKNGKTIDLL